MKNAQAILGSACRSPTPAGSSAAEITAQIMMTAASLHRRLELTKEISPEQIHPRHGGEQKKVIPLYE